MIKKLIIFLSFVLFATTCINCQTATVCKTYDDLAKAGTCSGQTVYIQNHLPSGQPKNCVTKSQVNATVQNNIQGRMAPLLSGLNQLRNEVDLLQRKLENATGTPRNCNGGLTLKDICIKLPYTEGPGVRYRSAIQMCKLLDSNLAEIDSNEMYQAVYQYINSTWVKQTHTTETGTTYTTFVWVWLGMTYQQPNNNPSKQITLQNGTQITINEWQNGYPTTNSGDNFMGMTVYLQNDPTNPNRGIWNWADTYSHYAIPLCSYKIN